MTWLRRLFAWIRGLLGRRDAFVKGPDVAEILRQLRKRPRHMVGTNRFHLPTTRLARMHRNGHWSRKPRTIWR